MDSSDSWSIGRSWRSPLFTSRVVRWTGLILLVGVLTGTALFHLAYGLSRLPSLRTAFLECLAIGSIYTLVMTVCLKGTASWMRGRVPLRSRWNVVAHVVIQSVGAIASFGLATVVVWLLLGDAVPLGTGLIVKVAAVSLVTALVWNSFAYMRAFYQRLRKSEAAALEARLQALRAQVNPHFLFNAFNSITALVHTHPQEAKDVVVNLAELFRYTLRASQNDQVTLADEIRAARLYLSIEEARFEDRLAVQFDVPESLSAARLPGMIVQPLVENAVKHGLSKTLGPCTIRVVARQQGDRVVVRVTDTGPGFETTDLGAVLEKGTGLANVRERLRLFFGGEADLRLLPQGVELSLPLHLAPLQSQ